MKRILTYKLFEAQAQAQAPNKLTKRQENFLNKNSGNSAKWTLNPQTGLVDVDGDFYCPKKELKDFKGIRFGRVSGNFHCRQIGLTSLEGAPLQVGGHFDCSYNPIGSLIGAPQEVGGFFACVKNNLSSLEGGPKQVDGAYDCRLNPLKSLDGAPEKVGGMFGCDAFRLENGEWNMGSWLELLDTGSAEAKQLILSLLSPEEINKRIAEDPAGMVMMLKGVWNSESFKDVKNQLIWPKGFEKEADLVGDLGNIGF